MATPLTHDERVAISRLQALLELLPTALDKYLRPAGITSFEYTVLEKLIEAPDGRLGGSGVALRTSAAPPQVFRVANSMQKRDLVCRAPCVEDARAINLEITAPGRLAYQNSRELWSQAVRDLVLDGINALPGNGVRQLSDLSFALLATLDRDRGAGGRYAACAADPEPEECAADPEIESCATDPEPQDCAADPIRHHGREI